MSKTEPAIRVLVVEDESIVAADLQDCLVNLGYVIAGATDNGPEAIALAARLQPDVILMDIMLAGTMSGTEAAEQIRRQLAVPVIYLTANSNASTFMDARQTAPYGYLIKPFDPVLLQTNIEIVVFRHRMEKEREELIQKLETALAEVKTLQGMLPICSCCKAVRDDQGYWSRIETYIVKHTNANFSHGYCPQCAVDQLEKAGVEVPAEMQSEARAQKARS
ncbi:MAG TPA: response regulator [Verrucomicrobiae bacterium]